jgi:hypothetical protein
MWGCLVKYDLFDILERKFSIDDLKLILDNVNKEILLSDGITGIRYKTMLSRLEKYKIKF